MCLPPTATARPLPTTTTSTTVYGDVAEHLETTVCASALALYKLLGFPDDRQVGALSLEKLDTMYRHHRTTVGYHIDSRTMTVSLLQCKRDETVQLIDAWFQADKFTLLQAAELCGKLESASTCCRWIRPYFFSIQNTLRAVLITKWKSVRGYQNRLGFPSSAVLFPNTCKAAWPP